MDINPATTTATLDEETMVTTATLDKIVVTTATLDQPVVATAMLDETVDTTSTLGESVVTTATLEAAVDAAALKEPSKTDGSLSTCDHQVGMQHEVAVPAAGDNFDVSSGSDHTATHITSDGERKAITHNSPDEGGLVTGNIPSERCAELFLQPRDSPSTVRSVAETPTAAHLDNRCQIEDLSFSAESDSSVTPTTAVQDTLPRSHSEPVVIETTSLVTVLSDGTKVMMVDNCPVVMDNAEERCKKTLSGISRSESDSENVTGEATSGHERTASGDFPDPGYFPDEEATVSAAVSSIRSDNTLKSMSCDHMTSSSSSSTSSSEPVSSSSTTPVYGSTGPMGSSYISERSIVSAATEVSLESAASTVADESQSVSSDASESVASTGLVSSADSSRVVTSYAAPDLTLQIRMSSPQGSIRTSAATSEQSSRRSSLTSAGTVEIPPVDPGALDDLERRSAAIVEDIDGMMKNLQTSLNKMSAATVACMQTYKGSVAHMCREINSSIKLMYGFIAKCEEIKKQTAHIHRANHQISEIKRLVERLEQHVL